MAEAINLSKKSELFLIKNILNLSSCASNNKLKLLEEAKASQASLVGPDELSRKLRREPAKSGTKADQIEEQVVDLSVMKPRVGAKKQSEQSKSNEEKKQIARRRSRRTMFSEWQLASLEWRFVRNKYLTTTDRKHIAKLLALNQLQVKTWFQVSNFLLQVLLHERVV